MVIACRRDKAMVAAFRRRKRWLLPRVFRAVHNPRLPCSRSASGVLGSSNPAGEARYDLGDDMKFVAVALVVAVASIAPAAAQTANTNVAAKAKRSYEQCYKDCTDRGGKPRSCGTQCANKS
jgi:hypothetical protein